MHPSAAASSPAPHDNIGLPILFQYGYKAIMEIDGVFQKGYISKIPTTPTNPASYTVPAIPQNSGGFLYMNLINTGTELLWNKHSFPATTWYPLFCAHIDH